MKQITPENSYDEPVMSANQAFATVVLGPPMAGTMVGLLLGGAAIHSYFSYLSGKLYRQDSFKLKCFLHVVMALAVTQTTLLFYGGYHYATWQARDANTIFGQTVTDCLCLTFVGVEGALVQLFLAQRGTALMGRSRWRWLYWLFVGAGVLGGLAGSVGFLVASLEIREGKDVNYFNIVAGLYQLSGAFVNSLITVTLCLSLRRNMTNFNKQTDSILAAIIKVTIQSAAPSALIAVTGATMGFVFSDDAWFTNITWAFFQTLTGLYALSLLAALNGREAVREAAAASQAGTLRFHRDVLTTVDGPETEEVMRGSRPRYPRGYTGLSGRKEDAGGSGAGVVAVGLGDWDEEAGGGKGR